MAKSFVHLVFLTTTLISGGLSAAESDAPSAEPNWLKRGTVALSTEDSRVFFTVGSAPPDAKGGAAQRAAADTAARSEMTKQLNNFGGALQADASPDASNTLIAMQGLTVALFQGVRIADRYAAADGTVYALAALDLQTLMATAQRARDRHLVAADVDPKALNDLFDHFGKKQTTVSPVIAVAESSWGDEDGKLDSKEVTPISGNKPAWIDSGVALSAPATAYLCGVGQGTSRSAAENAGYTVVVRQFQKQTAGISKDFAAALTRAGAAPAGSDNAPDEVRKSVLAAVLPKIKTRVIWNSPKGPLFALVCIERVAAVETLRSLMADDDKKATEALKAATKGDKSKAVTALSLMLHREIANAVVRAVSFSGVGVAAPFVPGDLADAEKPNLAAISVAVKADGPYWLGFANTVVSGLAARGFNAALLAVMPKSDVLLSSTITLDEDKGPSPASVGTVAMDVKDVAQNKVIAAFKESEKGNERNRFDSERVAVQKLAAKLAKQAGDTVEATMKH